ncbi:unnamed protein product [Polarella glacialis]|uniref:tRNA pseudouridine synthase n=1 Tax=Polarella glacialis TaxID=89957 RepID=A0A813LQR2_POLGL|nr:unnamed protein product [Polarella glacialis]
MVTCWKRYVYRIPLCGDQGIDVLRSFCETATQVVGAGSSDRPLDITQMQAAAALLLGSHDFAGFQSRGGRQSTVRTLHRCEVLEEFPSVAIVMEADGFLMHMCRILSGTLLEVGAGLRRPEQVLRIFESGNRSEAGPTLAAAGLCLEHVEHETEWSQQLSESISLEVTWPPLPDNAT